MTTQRPKTMTTTQRTTKTVTFTARIKVNLEDWANEYGMAPDEASIDAEEHVKEHLDFVVRAAGLAYLFESITTNANVFSDQSH